MNLTRYCCTAVLILATLIFPAAAFADGTFEFQPDASHVLAHAKTSDGKAAFYFRFTFPGAVSSGSTKGGETCTVRPDPKVVDCPAFTAAGGPTAALDASFVLAGPMACTDTIGLESDLGNQTFRPDGTLTFSGQCGSPPQEPPLNPQPPPTPPPAPDEAPAGGAVSKPRNPIVVGAGPGSGPHVRLFEPPTMASFFQFDAFGSGFTGGVRVAAGDVNGDGLTDVITAPGPGGGPNVKVFDGKTGGVIQSYFAFDPSVNTGLFVAAGDVNGDGRADVVVAPDQGGAPHVRVFSGVDASELRSFFAFDPAFPGGVRVAVGDINGDGFADLVTGAGPGGGPQVKVFDGKTGSLLQSFFALDPSFRGGVFVAAGDINGDGKADTIVGAGDGGGPNVRAFSGQNGASLASFFAYAPAFSGGVRVGAGDVNGDGRPDIITGPGAGAGPNVRVYDGGSQIASFFAFDAGFTGGVYVAGASEPFGATLPASPLILTGARVILSPSCPILAFGGACSGRITLLLPAVQRSAARAAAKKAKPRVLGSAKFKIPAGKRAKVRVALSPRARKALGAKRKLKVLARITTSDAGGNASTQEKTLSLTRR